MMDQCEKVKLTADGNSFISHAVTRNPSVSNTKLSKPASTTSSISTDNTTSPISTASTTSPISTANRPISVSLTTAHRETPRSTNLGALAGSPNLEYSLQNTIIIVICSAAVVLCLCATPFLVDVKCMHTRNRCVFNENPAECRVLLCFNRMIRTTEYNIGNTTCVHVYINVCQSHLPSLHVT